MKSQQRLDDDATYACRRFGSSVFAFPARPTLQGRIGGKALEAEMAQAAHDRRTAEQKADGRLVVYLEHTTQSSLKDSTQTGVCTICSRPPPALKGGGGIIARRRAPTPAPETGEMRYILNGAHSINA